MTSELLAWMTLSGFYHIPKEEIDSFLPVLKPGQLILDGIV